MANPFLDRDGYLNTKEVVALARDIDRQATKANLKIASVHYSPKMIPAYDKERAAKLGADAFEKKRAQLIKTRRNMPTSGSRMKMVVMLKEYKGIEELPVDFDQDIRQVLKAFELQTKKAEKFIESAKNAGRKVRDAANKVFDKNIYCFVEQILKDDNGNLLDGVDYVVGQSMMGKSLIVQLPNGGFVSIGKSDEQKFEKAKQPPKENPLVAKRLAAKKGTTKTAAKAPVKRTASKTEKAVPASRAKATTKARATKAEPVAKRKAAPAERSVKNVAAKAKTSRVATKAAPVAKKATAPRRAAH